MEKSKVKEIALKCFEANPELKEVSVVSDGNPFSKRERAAQHAYEIGGEYTTITRAEAEAPEVDVNAGADKKAAEKAAKEAAEKAEKEAAAATNSISSDGVSAEEKELIDSVVAEIAYDRMKELAVFFKLETADKKKATLIAALEAKKVELTKPE